MDQRKTSKLDGIKETVSDAVKIMRQMGTFEVRGSLNDVKETATIVHGIMQELKNNGIVVDAASAVEYALKSAEQSLTTAKEITTDVGKASPNTAKAIQQGIDRVKKQTNQAAKKIGEGNWRV